jgi:hypothetical protein
VRFSASAINASARQECRSGFLSGRDDLLALVQLGLLLDLPLALLLDLVDLGLF